MPSVILSKEGVVQMCNEGFEMLISDTFKTKVPPLNFLKFVSND